MKKNFNKGIALAFLGLAICVSSFTSCKKSKYPGYEDTETGLAFKFHKKGDGKITPKEGDIMSMVIVYKNSKDSVIFDSRKQGQPIMVPLQKPSFKGGIEEGFAMMSVGDSASFVVNADSFFVKTFKMETPKFVEKGSGVYFDLKLEKVTTKAEFEKEQQENQAKQMAEMESRKNAEGSEMQKYLSDNKITAAPTATGLVYIEQVKGKGAKAEKGKTVTVHYTGTLLNGTKFDSSFDHPDKAPIEFKLGEGAVIPGWDEGISMMNIGGKAKFIIPSSLAYGPSGQGPVIPPYSTLIFDVELVNLK
jgi:FKBP-type peptidyl-prolyl cis-trans isomerase FkpA